MTNTTASSERLTTAAPLEARRHGAATHLSIARLPVLRLVALDDDLAADQTDRAATEMLRDHEAMADPWSADGATHATLTDPQRGLYLAGERHLAMFDAAAGRFVPAPGVLWHLGVTAEKIPPQGSGLVDVWLVNSIAAHAVSSHRLTAHDWLGGGAAAYDRVVVFQHLQSRRWYFLAVDPQSRALPANSCRPASEFRLGPTGTAASLADATPVVIPFDEVPRQPVEALSLGTGSEAGEVSVSAAGMAELQLHVTAAVDGTPSGENQTHWWIERRAPAASVYVTIPDSLTLLNHPHAHDGSASQQIVRTVALAYGDRLRVPACRSAGSDTLKCILAGSGQPTNLLGVRFLCATDTQNHATQLTSIAGTPYDPHIGTGDQLQLKLTAYYRLEESGATDEREDSSGRGLHLRVLPTEGGEVGNASGHVLSAAHFTAAANFLNRGGFGSGNPEAVFRPASQQISVVCWVTIHDLAGIVGTAHVLGLEDDDSWRLMIDTSGNLTARLGQVEGEPGDPDPTAEATVTALPTGKPLLMVAEFDGLRGVVRVRVRSADETFDAQQSATSVAASGWPNMPDVWHFNVGAASSASFVAMSVEQLAIWHDAWLRPQQEDFLFAAGQGRQLM